MPSAAEPAQRAVAGERHPLRRLRRPRRRLRPLPRLGRRHRHQGRRPRSAAGPPAGRARRSGPRAAWPPTATASSPSPATTPAARPPTSTARRSCASPAWARSPHDANIFYPASWRTMDSGDADFGAEQPGLSSTVPGATPSKIVVAHRQGRAHLLPRRARTSAAWAGSWSTSRSSTGGDVDPHRAGGLHDATGRARRLRSTDSGAKCPRRHAPAARSSCPC